MMLNKLINKSELARQIGLSRTSFENKLKKINYNKFSEDEEKNIKEVMIKLAKQIIQDYSR